MKRKQNDNVKRKCVKKLLFVLIVFLLVLTPPLSRFFILHANAGTMTSASLTLTDSRAGQTSVGYNFAYTTTVTTSIKQLTILFCTTASGTCTTPTGISTTGATRSSDNLAGTGRTDTFTTNGTLTTVVTTPATQSTQAVTTNYTGITNSTTANTTFFARVTTYSDTGSTTIDTVTVAAATLTSTSIAITASVDSNLTFSIAAVTSGGTVNSATTNITTTASTIPFGTLTVGTAAIGAHDVTITTNAANGFTVTVAAPTNSVTGNPPLYITNTASSANIDSFTGTHTSPTTWSAPAGTAASVNTGFLGYSTEDTNVSGFSSNKWAGLTTASDSVLTSTTGSTSYVKRVGWQVQVNSLQPAGSYQGTVVMVATPTY